jgi:hypothetical protein
LGCHHSIGHHLKKHRIEHFDNSQTFNDCSVRDNGISEDEICVYLVIIVDLSQIIREIKSRCDSAETGDSPESVGVIHNEILGNARKVYLMGKDEVAIKEERKKEKM